MTPEQLLGAAAGDAEAGDDLVEDQQGADPVALGPQPLEEAGRRRRPGPCWRRRLDDDARRRCRRARAPRCRARRWCRRPRRSVTPAEPGRPSDATAVPPGDEQGVGVAVVVAGELHAAWAGRWRRGRGGWRVMVASVPLLTRRTFSTDGHPLARWPRPAATSPRGGRAEGGAVGRGRADGLDDRRVGVAGDDGAVALHEVDVASVPSTSHTWAPSARATKYGRAADRPEGPHRRVHAAGDDPLARVEQRLVGGGSCRAQRPPRPRGRGR